MCKGNRCAISSYIWSKAVTKSYCRADHVTVFSTNPFKIYIRKGSLNHYTAKTIKHIFSDLKIVGE